LAVLEYTANYRRRGWVPATVLGRASIPAGVRIETVRPDDLPSRWFAADPPPRLQEIGGQWLRRGKSTVLQVPSAIVIEEWNYLLNPLHADFGKLSFSAPKAFSFDRRPARSRKK
jgi:RES domain-containing protein